MTKYTLILALSVVTFLSANAQIKPFSTGDQSIAINVNPIFDFVGNMFNNSESNNFWLNGAGVVYRKAIKDNRAIRLTLTTYGNKTIQLFSSNDPFNYVYQNFSFYGSYGKEYFTIQGKQAKWRPYAGWSLILNVTTSKRDYDYLEDPEFVSERIISKNHGTTINTGLGGFLGVNYFFSDQLFIGVEIMANALVGYRFEEFETVENYTYDWNGQVALVTKGKVNQGGSGFIWSFDTANPILLRAGIRF